MAGGPSLAPSSLARKSYLLGKGWRNQWGVKYQCGIECGTFEYDRTHVLVVLTALRRGRRRRLCRRQLSDLHLIYNVQVARILMAIDLLGRHIQQYGMEYSIGLRCVATLASHDEVDFVCLAKGLFGFSWTGTFHSCWKSKIVKFDCFRKWWKWRAQSSSSIHPVKWMETSRSGINLIKLQPHIAPNLQADYWLRTVSECK